MNYLFQYMHVELAMGPICMACHGHPPTTVASSLIEIFRIRVMVDREYSAYPTLVLIGPNLDSWIGADSVLTQICGVQRS